MVDKEDHTLSNTFSDRIQEVKQPDQKLEQGQPYMWQCFELAAQEDRDQILLPIETYGKPLLDWISGHLGIHEISTLFESGTSPAQRLKQKFKTRTLIVQKRKREEHDKEFPPSQKKKTIGNTFTRKREESNQHKEFELQESWYRHQRVLGWRDNQNQSKRQDKALFASTI